MMNQKIINIMALILISVLPVSGYSQGMIIPSGAKTVIYPGITVLAPSIHRIPIVAEATSDFPSVVSVWIDPGMAVVTGLDYAASESQKERTIKAKKAIQQLEEALGGGSGGGTSGGVGTSGDSLLATVYTADQVAAKIEVKKVSAEQMFENTRQAVQEYLFETPDATIKGECDLDDKSCATQRQNEWLLASVTLASATADKVLDMTAKQDVADGQTVAEKSQDEQSTGDTGTTGGGITTLTAHFQKLASNFNAQTSPTGLYNRMADIVLDTHRQINDANVLLGRDLEMSGLRIINETGPVLKDGSDETEE